MQRKALGLRYLGDLSHRAVGEALGIDEAAARRNAFEGLRSLRARLGERGDLTNRAATASNGNG